MYTVYWYGEFAEAPEELETFETEIEAETYAEEYEKEWASNAWEYCVVREN